MFKNITTRKTDEIVTDALSVVLGVCLALTPWVLGFAGEPAAAWNAWLVGAAIAVVAVGAFLAFRPWEGWVKFALGVWAIVAPWLLGFSHVDSAIYAHVIVGVMVAALSAIEIWVGRNRPLSTA